MFSKSNWIRIALTVFVIITLFTKIVAKDKCYVLALEGGGDHGAYQAGAIKGLAYSVPDGDTKWDVVTGISVGALNGAGLSIFDIGKEKEASEFLVETWTNIKGKSDVYQNWWLGPLEGLFYKTSLYDSSPLKKLLAKLVSDNELKRKFVLGATNFKTGAYDKYDDEMLAKEEYSDAILSSSAFPVLLSNIEFRNNTYMDGGVKIGVDMAAGINKCLDAGFTEDQVIVDAVLCNSKILDQFDKPKYNTLNVLLRLLEIYSYDNAMRDIDTVRGFFPKVQYRYLVAPTRSMPGGLLPLVFSHKEIEKMIKYGIEDAENVVKNSANGFNGFDQVVQEYKKERFANLGRKPGKTADSFNFLQ